MQEILDTLAGGQDPVSAEDALEALEKFEDLKQETRNVESLLSVCNQLGAIGRREVLEYLVFNICLDDEIGDRVEKSALVKEIIIDLAKRSYGGDHAGWMLYLILQGEERVEHKELIKEPFEDDMMEWYGEIIGNRKVILSWLGHEDRLFSNTAMAYHLKEGPREIMEIDISSFQNILSNISQTDPGVPMNDRRYICFLQKCNLDGENCNLLAIRQSQEYRDLIDSELINHLEMDEYWKMILEEGSEKEPYESWKAVLGDFTENPRWQLGRLGEDTRLIPSDEVMRAISEEFRRWELPIPIDVKIRIGFLVMGSFELDQSIQKDLEEEISLQFEKSTEDEMQTALRNRMMMQMMRVLNPIKSTIISESLEKIVNNGENSTALILLARYGGDAQLPLLGKLAMGANFDLKVLGSIGTEKSCEMLLGMLLEAVISTDEPKQLRICDAFAGCDTKSVREILIKVIINGYPFFEEAGTSEIKMRQYACYIIAYSCNPSFIPMLKNCLNDDSLSKRDLTKDWVKMSINHLEKGSDPEDAEYILRKPYATLDGQDLNTFQCACGERFSDKLALYGHCRKKDGRTHYVVPPFG